MIRTTIVPDKQHISIDVPEAYIGKQIEVLLYSTEELTQDNKPRRKMSDFRGKLKLSDEQYADLQQHVKDLRNEWERDI